MDFELNDSELRLAREAEEARPCDFSDQLVDGAPGVAIRAWALRRMLLGLPVGFAGDEKLRLVRIPGPGLHVIAARIDDEEINLDDARAADGEALPPLVLERCVIRHRISLARARLRHLSLKGSRLTHLHAPDVQIDGPLDISDLQSADPEAERGGAQGEGLCWLEFQGARIEGTVEVANSSLAAPRQRSGFIKGAALPRYALDLRDARVRDNVRLQPNMRAVGGVAIVGADIGGDLWGLGAQLSAEEGVGLFAQSVSVRGSLFLRCVNQAVGDTARFICEGDVWLLGAKIGGSLEMDGAHLKGALVAVNADVGADTLLRAWDGRANGKPSRLPFTIDGDVNLQGLKIAGDLDMEGACLSANVNLTDAAIAGSISVDLQRPNAGKPIEFSFRDANAGSLNDRGGDGFGSWTKLVLGGFQYTRLVDGGETVHEEWRRRALTFQGGAKQRLPFGLPIWLALAGSIYGLVAPRLGLIWTPWIWVILIVLAAVGWFLGLDLQQPLWQRRKAWLNRQYDGGKPNGGQFNPDPYERLARFFRSEGRYEDARRTSSERLTVERKYRMFFLWKIFIWPYWFFFDYGLSPRRAVITFLGFIAVGWLAVSIANHGPSGTTPLDRLLDRMGAHFYSSKPILVISTATVNSVAAPNARFRLVPAMAGSQAATDGELPCGDDIEPILYAIDAFAPALNLDQENRCSVSTQAYADGWRFAKAAYTLLGWIVTSLTILTVSGILRRQVEQ